jgi:hypothetical protein
MSDRTLVEPAIELSSDPAMTGRVRRLAVVSSIALGAVLVLVVGTVDADSWVLAALALGWILMPTLLVLSVRLPVLRHLLVVPSALVSVGLLAVVVIAPPDDAVVEAGWLLVTGGVLLGGVLGLWFWFRLLPVPASLDDPFSASRWSLIGVHVVAIVLGLALVVAGAFG